MITIYREEVMFENSGKKVRIIAFVQFLILLLTSIIIGGSFIIIGSQQEGALVMGLLIGFAIIILGTLLAWILSIGLYAFGEMVENVGRISRNVDVLMEYYFSEDDEDDDENKKERARENLDKINDPYKHLRDDEIIID